MKYISVTMLVFLVGLLGVVYADAHDAEFGWSPNTERDLAGYKIHYGPASRDYTEHVDVGLGEQVGGEVRAIIDPVPDVKTYFAATAYDTEGNESGYSNEVVYNPPPDNPEGFLVGAVSITMHLTPVQ